MRQLIIGEHRNPSRLTQAFARRSARLDSTRRSTDAVSAHASATALRHVPDTQAVLRGFRPLARSSSRSRFDRAAAVAAGSRPPRRRAPARAAPHPDGDGNDSGREHPGKRRSGKHSLAPAQRLGVAPAAAAVPAALPPEAACALSGEGVWSAHSCAAGSAASLRVSAAHDTLSF
jgi:hypothetical protein